ncbi:TPA: hypothetical protein DIC39_02665 [Patescibacteria group bacterium]|nr:MAG: hypothetical protein UX54_C0001G0018 [Parcubacteria group bacterium GW2011_GWA2_46_39]HBV33268.1 hypothetical protein [Patescibacteria group bacterium]HCU47936.1 hypothetical protein [Patescibacteria group bacterium]
MAKTLGASTSFSWRSFWRSPLIFGPVALALIISLASLWFTWQQLELGQGFLTIRYSIYVGANWVAPWFFIYLPPVVALLILAINTVLAFVLGTRHISLRYLLLTAAALASAALAWLQFLLVVFNS